MRTELDPRKFYTLINHGPTTLISATDRNTHGVMSAAWVMPIDINPPRLIAAVSDSFTRGLMLKSGEFAVNIPPVEMADIVYTAGTTSGRDIDKYSALGLTVDNSSVVSAPLIRGCLGWIECRIVPNQWMLQQLELLVADVVAAWADDQTYRDNAFHFQDGCGGTLHHISRGKFFVANRTIDAESRRAN